MYNIADRVDLQLAYRFHPGDRHLSHSNAGFAIASCITRRSDTTGRDAHATSSSACGANSAGQTADALATTLHCTTTSPPMLLLLPWMMLMILLSSEAAPLEPPPTTPSPLIMHTLQLDTTPDRDALSPRSAPLTPPVKDSAPPIDVPVALALRPPAMDTTPALQLAARSVLPETITLPPPTSPSVLSPAATSISPPLELNRTAVLK